MKPYECSNTMNINQISSTFDNHINIKKVKEYFPDASSNNFEFTEVSQDEVKKEVLHLNVKKSSTSNSIPATILKQSEIYLPFLTNSINYTIKNGEFPDILHIIPLSVKDHPRLFSNPLLFILAIYKQ